MLIKLIDELIESGIVCELFAGNMGAWYEVRIDGRDDEFIKYTKFMMGSTTDIGSQGVLRIKDITVLGVDQHISNKQKSGIKVVDFKAKK